ncbi:MAG: class I adenylate-forming enzyme family protein [Gaiellaceae bacterium]
MSGVRNLARLAEETYERRGDYPALWFEGDWHSSGDLFERARRLQLGIEPGDRVVVLMENSPEVGVAYHAIWRAGGVVTPAVFLLTRDELERLIRDAEPALVLTSEMFADTARAAAGDVRVVADLAELEGDASPFVERDESDLAALVYTGGTTGHAKGVMLTHANLYEAGRAGHEAGHVDGVDRSLSCLPLAHSYGLLVLNVALHHPGRQQSVLMRWFEPETWLRLAQDHRVQIAPLVPSMLYLLLQQPLEQYDLSELRFVASGAAPLAVGAMEEFIRRVAGVQIREGYGLTETSALVSTNPPGRCKHGTVGPPVPGTEVRIVDGEVCVRSELVMAGYWNAPELTAETIRDGWLYTGDMGRLDDHGYLTIVDRKKDLIIRGGFNVFPRDVEEALLEHPAVATACVLGRPDALYGEEVVAFVTLAAPLEEEELVTFGRERLGGYKYPREIHVVDALPLTPVGKADRKALREVLAAQGGVAG